MERRGRASPWWLARRWSEANRTGAGKDLDEQAIERGNWLVPEDLSLRLHRQDRGTAREGQWPTTTANLGVARSSCLPNEPPYIHDNLHHTASATLTYVLRDQHL